MKVKELTAYIAQKIAEGKLREDSEVLIGSDEFGGLYLYSPDMFHMVCMSEDGNFYKREVYDELDTAKRMFNRSPDKEWRNENLKEKQAVVDKVENEWKDALVI